MLDNIIKDREFAVLMQRNIQDAIIYLFEKEQNFSILCNIDDVSFEPPLPKHISDNFRALTLFFIAGYTFESAKIEDGYLIFEAGFGSENFGSVVSVPLLSIMQIIVDETPILVNLSTFKEIPSQNPTSAYDEHGVQNSMKNFLSNPENSKFLKNTDG